MPTDVNAIEVEEVRKCFRLRNGSELVAVDDVSFHVPPGQSLGIVGESGAGKTTLGAILAGLETCTAGRISVFGADRTSPARRSRERRRRARDIQVIFQNPYSSLDPRQTADACLDEALRLHTELTRAGRADRVRTLLEQVGLTETKRATRPARLSGGERQRLAIARALAVEPRVLVLDEPVSALDVSIQAQVLTLLNDLRREHGITYLFISHDLGVMRQVTDELLVMQKGKVVERGRTDTLLAHPSHPYTQLLRRSVPGPAWHLERPAALPALRGDVEDPAVNESPLPSRPERPGAETPLR